MGNEKRGTENVIGNGNENVKLEMIIGIGNGECNMISATTRYNTQKWNYRIVMESR